jgi:hypothetical protein
MQATRFPSKRFPWRVQLPGRYSADAAKKGGSRRTTYKTVNAFFNWACKYGYLAANPLGPIDTKNEIGDFGMNAEYCRLLTNSA